MNPLNHLKTTYRLRFFNGLGKKNATDIQRESVSECVQDCFELGNEVSEEIQENNIEVWSLGSPILLEEDGGKEEGEREEEDGEKSCGKQNSATVKPEEEFEFLTDESFELSSTSWISTSRKKQKPQQKRTSASFEENKEAQHNERGKNKRVLEKTVMPIPLKKIKTTTCNVGERSFDGFQNASRFKQVMAMENDKSQLVRSVVTTQETRKQMQFKNKYKDSAEIHKRSYSISGKQSQDLIPLLEADQKLPLQIQPVETIKQSLSQNKLPTLTKLQYETQQECTVLALSSKDCTQSKHIDIYSENSGSMPTFVPVAQQSCHNILVKKPQLPSKKQLGIQKKKKRPPVGPMEMNNRQLVSKKKLENDHGEQQLDKKNNLHPFKLRAELKRTTSQIVKETSLPKPQSNIVHQEDSCEQHVEKKHSNVSVTQQNSEGFLSHGPLCSNEMFRREWNPFNTDDSDSDKSVDLEENLHSPVSNSLKHKLILPTNTPNVRRSKRTRIKPLQYWRGERIDYKITPSGGFVIGGIISPEQRESRKHKAKVAMKSVSEMENLHNNSIFLEDFSQPAVVFDKASNQQILLACMNNGSSPVYCISNEKLSIYKYLNTPSFSSGKIILNPLKEKGYQYSYTDTLVFHINCGKLLLMLYDQSYCLTAGNYFFIPPGNVYNIRNLLNKECVILFTQLKGKEK